MKHLKIEGTRRTPTMDFDPEQGLIKITGRSIPENTWKFYQPYLDWVKTYSESTSNTSTRLFIKLEYCNSSSSRYLLDILLAFDDLAANSHPVYFEWHYADNDEDMFEIGQDLASFLKRRRYKWWPISGNTQFFSSTTFPPYLADLPLFSHRSFFCFGSLLVFLAGAQGVWAQWPSLKTQTQKEEVCFFVQNPAACPFQLQLNIVNFRALAPASLWAKDYQGIIPAQTDTFVVLRMQKAHPDSLLRYSYAFTPGDPAQTQPWPDFPYQLPYPSGLRYFVLQGYNGAYSHRRQFALDFKMPEGSAVAAAREGVVIFVKQDSNQGGKNPKFANDANKIIIHHPDGTFAEYWHLQFQGSLVREGDRVNAGQIIGRSGNTGWSTTPHLHFVVKRPVYGKLVSWPVKFLNRKMRLCTLKPWRKYRAVEPR
ncbi:MAG: DUF1987 family protein [Microscillaceae bacterium]|nr:DUF1987 family protein [Microscillaceae bacterium]